MKFLKNFFKLSFVFLILQALFPSSDSYNDHSVFPDPLVNDASKILTKIYSDCQKGAKPEALLNSLYSVFDPGKHYFKILILKTDLSFILWKTSDRISVLAWIKNKGIDNGFSHASFPPGSAVLTPEEFDLWLLANIDVLKELLGDNTFLEEWLPENDNLNAGKPSDSLKYYLFSVHKPRKSYTLAAVIGEDKFFPDITDDDQELYFLHLPLLYYTINSNGKTILYCRIDSTTALENLKTLLDSFWADKDQRDFFKKAFETKQKGVKGSVFDDPSFLEEIKKSLDAISQKYDLTNIPVRFIPELKKNIKNFLISNGIYSLQAFNLAPDEFKLEIAEKFLCAKTTAFFRDWRDIKYLDQWFTDLDKRAANEKRPVKIKVFGCSTGQEPLSYAFEFLDRGLNNFRILASDIDEKVIAEAMKLTYSPDKFLTLSMKKSEQMLKNYFDINSEGNHEIKYKKFFQDKLHYCVQDITKPLKPDEDPDFNPPYDIISVKNVLLYLDNNTVETTVKNITRLLSNEGILIIWDKDYRMNRLLPNMLKNFIGISESMALKPPADETEDAIMRVFNLFKGSLPPPLARHFYFYSKIKNVPGLETYFYNLCANGNQNNLYNLEVVFEKFLNNSKNNGAWSILSKMLRVDPLRFIQFFMKYREAGGSIKELSKKQIQTLIKLYQLITSKDFGKMNEVLLEKEINSLNASAPEETLLTVATCLAGRDLGRFISVAPSKEGRWLKLGLDLLNRVYPDKKSDIILDYKLQLLHNYLLFFSRDNNFNEENTLLKEAVDQLAGSKYENFSLNGKISGGKIVCLYAKQQPEEKEKMAMYQLAIDLCSLDETEMGLLSDNSYCDCFMVLGTANTEMGFMKSAFLSREEKMDCLKKAVDYFDNILSVKTVYASTELNIQQKALKGLEELEK